MKNLRVLTVLCGLTLNAQALTQAILPTATYQTQDLEKWFYTNRVCDSNLSAKQCETNQTNLKKDLNFVNAQINSKNPKNISQVKAYAITYNTQGINGEKRTVSGGILVPDTAKIKGMLLFYHPTEVSKYNVPSCFYAASNLPSYCNISAATQGSNYAMELGSVFASQGYVVVMPDYIGQGIDSSVMHPYVAFPQVSAVNGLDMLAPTTKLLHSLGYNTKLNLFLSGYSEGGSYVLWASKLLQTTDKNKLTANNLTLALTAPISGAYDLSHSQVPLEFANVSVYPKNDKYNVLSMPQLLAVKPSVSSYMLSAVAYYRFNESYTSVFKPEFANMSCGKECQANGHQYTIGQLFSATDLDLTISGILSAIVHSAFNSVNLTNNQKYSAGNNSILAFTAPGLQQNQVFNQTIEAADIYKWKTKSPVSLIYLDYDSVVTNLSSKLAYQEMSKLSASKLVKNLPISNFKYTTYFGINPTQASAVPLDHMNARAFLYIAALNEFDQLKN